MTNHKKNCVHHVIGETQPRNPGLAAQEYMTNLNHKKTTSIMSSSSGDARRRRPPLALHTTGARIRFFRASRCRPASCGDVLPSRSTRLTHASGFRASRCRPANRDAVPLSRSARLAHASSFFALRAVVPQTEGAPSSRVPHCGTREEGEFKGHAFKIFFVSHDLILG